MRFSWKVYFCLVFGFAGCGESSDRIAFSGNITAAGEPITGTIRFAPVSSGPLAMTTITKGRYNFTSMNGPVPGDYNVSIELLSGSAKKGAAAQVIVPRKWTATRRVEANNDFETDFLLDAPAESESK